MKFLFVFFLFIYPFYSLSSLSKVKNNEENNEENNRYYLQLGVGYRTPKYMPLRYGSPTYKDGVFSRDLKQNDGFEKDIGIGYRFNEKFRISINYKNYYQPAHDFVFYNNFSDGTYVDNPKLKVDAYSINIFRDFTFKNSDFSPYIGCGIGFANTHNPDFGSFKRNNSDYSFTSSFKAHNSGSLYKEIMAGINYRINTKNTLFIQSAYSGVDDYVVKVGGVERVQIQNPKTLTFLSGIRISF